MKSLPLKNERASARETPSSMLYVLRLRFEIEKK